MLGSTFAFARIRGGGTVKAGAGDKGSLEVKSAYPGIIMIALGAGLVAIGLTRSASPNFEGVMCGPNPVWTKAENGEPRKLNPDYALNPAQPSPAESSEEDASGAETGGSSPTAPSLKDD